MRHRRIAEVVVLSLALAAPAFAGGPAEKPDGVGNLNAVGGPRDFTGWTSLYWVLGVKENAEQRTIFTCSNPGTSKGDPVWAVQLWADAGGSSRSPVANVPVNFFLPSGDLDSLSTTTDFAGNPALANNGIGKIIGIGDGGRGKPKLLCDVRIENKSDGSTAAVLRIIPYGGKEAKPKDTK